MLPRHTWIGRSPAVIFAAIVVVTVTICAPGEEVPETGEASAAHKLFVVGDSAIVDSKGTVWTLTPDQVSGLNGT